MNTLFYCLQ